MIWLAVAYLVLCIGYLVYAMLTAPEGYEDKEGFHYGKKIT